MTLKNKNPDFFQPKNPFLTFFWVGRTAKIGFADDITLLSHLKTGIRAAHRVAGGG
jgi:hypothetical protein